MLVKEFIQLARDGELKNINAGSPESLSEVVGYLNLGLIELYKRFPLNVKEHIIEDTTETLHVLPDDVLQVVEVYGLVDSNGEDIVVEVPINEPSENYSIFLPSYNTVQIPYMNKGVVISLLYHAAPQYVTYTDNEGEIAYTPEELPIPLQLVEALLNYVGYRAHGSMNSDINTETTTHYKRFEASCSRIHQLGLYVFDSIATKNRLYNRGFV